MKKEFKSLVIIALGMISLNARIAAAQSINLKEYFKNNKLEVYGSLKPLDAENKSGVTGKGIVWIKNKSFSTGVIEVDLRGRDVFQQSFLGIAFHGVDTTTYEAIYFRPFNFRSTDSVRKIHAVQYVCEPDYHWDRLRKEFNGVYEKGIVPAPDPSQWLHARIEVGETKVKVYVNNADTPALVVERLTNRKTGLIGLWTFKTGLEGDFANLSIKKSKMD